MPMSPKATNDHEQARAHNGYRCLSDEFTLLKAKRQETNRETSNYHHLVNESLQHEPHNNLHKMALMS